MTFTGMRVPWANRHYGNWTEAGTMASARYGPRLGFSTDLRPVTPFCIKTPTKVSNCTVIKTSEHVRTARQVLPEAQS